MRRALGLLVCTGLIAASVAGGGLAITEDSTDASGARAASGSVHVHLLAAFGEAQEEAWRAGEDAKRPVRTPPSFLSKHVRMMHGGVSRGSLGLVKASVEPDSICEDCPSWPRVGDLCFANATGRCFFTRSDGSTGCCNCTCIFSGFEDTWPRGYWRCNT
jgi:hypothetical protein